MLLPAPPLYPRKRKPRPTRRPPTPVAAGPVLVSATFGGIAEPTLTLVFDRAIDVSGLALGELFVYDGPGGVEWGGSGVFEQPGPESLSMTMSEQAEFTGAGVTFTAAGGAGIVASDGGAAWAGVSDLELPFPS